MNTQRQAVTIHLLCLSLLTLLAALPGIYGLSIFYGDEGFYLDCSEIFVKSNYLVRVHNGELHLAKPPAFNWFVALSYKIFGISLLSGRLPSIIAAVLTVLGTYWFALWLYRSPKTAFSAGIALASSYVFYKHSRLALTDMTMTFGILVATFFFFRAAMTEHKLFNLLIASFGVGLAGMIKGHVGTVLGIMPLLVFLLLDRKSPNTLRLKHLIAPTTWGPAFVLCGWWYIYLLTSNTPAISFAANHPDSTQTLRDAFIQYFHTGEVAARPHGGIGAIIRNLFYYSLGLVRGFLPWSCFVLAGFFFGKRYLRQEIVTKRREMSMLLACIVPLLLFFIFVIRQQTRLRYLLPAGPALAILNARALTLHSESGSSSRLTSRPLALGASLLLFYNLLFVVILPLLFKNPVQELSYFLQPRLAPNDQVLFVGIEKSWDTFVTTILGGYTVTDLGKDASADELITKLAEIRGTRPSNPADKIYIITSPEIWRALSEKKGTEVELIKEASVRNEWRRFKDFWATVKGDPSRISIMLVQTR